MSDLSTVVQVNIDVQTQSIARTAFGIPAVIGQFATTQTTPAFSRARVYASVDEMIDEGWLTTDPVYKHVAALFAQNPRPSTVVVGRRDSGDSTWAAAMAAIQAENDSWYTFVVEPTAQLTADVEIEEVGTWVLTQKKIGFVQSSTAAIYDPASTTDVLYNLRANGRMALMYRGDTRLGECTPAAWLGEGLPWPIGSSQWAYKTLAGSTADNLTSGQKTAIHGKNGNTYTTLGGVDVTERGKVTSGEWLDVVFGLDWLEANLQEEIYSALVNTRKISYDDAGILVIAGIVQKVLESAGRNGVLQLSSISVSTPKYADISTADKQARKLPNVTFRALLQGAILTTEIRGTVSL